MIGENGEYPAPGKGCVRGGAEVGRALAAHAIGLEAEASVALDGDTQALGREGGHTGFGCPGCGNYLDLKGLTAETASKGLTCCGYLPTQDQLARWFAGKRAIGEAGQAATDAEVMREQIEQGTGIPNRCCYGD